MNVDEHVGQRSIEHPGEKIALCESHKDRDEDHPRHAYEKEIFEAAIGLADDSGCHDPSETR